MKPPTITDAHRLCDSLGARGVIVIAFAGERFAAASYGETKAECASVGKTLDEIVSWLQRGAIPAPDVR